MKRAAKIHLVDSAAPIVFSGQAVTANCGVEVGDARAVGFADADADSVGEFVAGMISLNLSLACRKCIVDMGDDTRYTYAIAPAQVVLDREREG